jgi:hypothetical protein
VSNTFEQAAVWTLILWFGGALLGAVDTESFGLFTAAAVASAYYLGHRSTKRLSRRR